MTIVWSRHLRRLIFLLVLLVSFASAPSRLLAQSNNAPASTAPTAGSMLQLLATVTAHTPDAFYDPPEPLPARPGVLLRSEKLKDVTLPAGMQGWRILYTTTVDDKTPATAVATVFAPAERPAGPLPVIMWEHGTTGALQHCMPSLVSMPTLGIPAVDRIMKAGWVIVATDYQFTAKDGPHPYLIGEGEARAGLDSVRAARQMPELALGTRTAVWGHSQGGHAALWTGIVGPRYAPEVEIAGVAAIAPAANIADIIAMNAAVDKRLGPYLALSYSHFYDDVKFDQAVRPAALAAAREIALLCVFLPRSDPLRIAVLTTTFEGRSLALDTDAALAERIEQNAANHPIPAPVVIAQGVADTVVPAPATDAYVAGRCAAGQSLEYWTFAGLDHGGIVRSGAGLDAPLMAWTAARFATEEPVRGCARKSF
jgi:fermentation-respiration switch protein FrsA (DUF1100 family)